ncbi:MAG: glycine--tRNA ligase [Chitinophagales bacterium]|nr:glycine--tRNA ligase [Bacteroidota bacterium]MCB9043379.1 glycine--tRNA ligase [Chitinophagales bacterium]
MKNTADYFKNLIAHCKEYGFVFPSSEIYDGLSAVYDYGPYGVMLKNNLRDYWWRAMVQMHENIVGIDAAIFMHPSVWKASGHVDAFNDPLIDNKDSKKRYRADVLIEDYVANKIDAKIDKEIEKAKQRFGDTFDEPMFVATNVRVQEYKQKKENILTRFARAMSTGELADLKNLIDELEIACPESGSRNWTEVRQFNLMFATQMGAVDGDIVYLRPETAQGIFVNFLNVLNTSRQKIPFGIAQTGKAFRNEIVARQFIFRMREFEQMEMQFFVRPGEEMKWYDYWKNKRMLWHKAITPAEKLRFKDHDNLAHYANAAVDIQFEFPFGFKELEGIHSRTDFDLKSHQELSKKKLQYFDPELGESYIPYVVETSVGLDRLFLTCLSNAFTEETLEDGSSRTVLKIHPILAPIKVAVLPLLKNKEELTGKAREVFNMLKTNFICQYDEKDAIGKRYRRQDAIGTPYCITIDFDTLETNTVTLRERDSMGQVRIDINDIVNNLHDKLHISNLLTD